MTEGASKVRAKPRKAAHAAGANAAKQRALPTKSGTQETGQTKKSKAPASSGIDPVAYNAIVAIARLQELRLTSSRTEFKVAAMELENHDRQLRVSDELEDWGLNEERETLWGTVSFKAQSIDGTRKPIIVEGSYYIGYEIKGQIDRAASRAFLKRVARFAAYPYFRALFAAVAGQASVVLPPLPVLTEAPRLIKKSSGKSITVVSKKSSAQYRDENRRVEKTTTKK